MKRVAGLIGMLILLLTILACDDFILADQFESAGDRLASGIVNPNGTGLYFTLQSTEMTSGESKIVTILGGVQPYTLTMLEQLIYTSGETDLGTFTLEHYSSGATCGEIQLNVIDAAGETATVNIFVRPQKVSTLAVEKLGNNSHTVTWEYPASLVPFVESFEIQRKREGGVFEPLSIVASSIQPLEYTDIQSLNENLNYRIRVLAADVRSVFVEVYSPK